MINEKHIHIISAKEAKKRGMYLYFTGKPCKYGHIAERYVKSYTCLECERETYKENKDAYIERAMSRYQSAPEEAKEYYKNYINGGLLEVSERRSKNIKDQIGRDLARGVELELMKAYRTLKFSNPHLQAYNFLKMSEMVMDRYDKNKSTNVSHHVDHIIPLKGSTVSGLHVWYNLQIIEGSANSAKNNSYKQSDATDENCWNDYLKYLEDTM